MEKIRVTDDEIVVDSMILASRGEIPPALPSFGRNLVPYFCPNGSTDPTEDDINHATDLDAYRRGGASILDIPEPESSKEPVKGGPMCGGAGGLEGLTQIGKVGKSRSMTISEPLKVRKRGVAAKGRQKVPQKVPGHKSEEVSSPTSPLDDPPVLTASSDSDITDSEVQPSSGTGFLAQGPTWQQEHLQKSPSKPKKKTARRSLRLSKEESFSASKYVQNPRDSLPISSASLETLAPDMLLKARQTSMPGSAGSPPGPRAGLPERFAGAAFHNSPAPSCLPLPTFAYQKSTAPARLNLFPSPPREPPPPKARSSPPPPVPASQELQKAAALLSSPGPGPQLQRASSVPSEPEVMQASRDLATLKLRELLKLGTPSPTQATSEQSHSHAATRDLRRMLQLA